MGEMEQGCSVLQREAERLLAQTLTRTSEQRQREREREEEGGVVQKKYIYILNI